MEGEEAHSIIRSKQASNFGKPSLGSIHTRFIMKITVNRAGNIEAAATARLEAAVVLIVIRMCSLFCIV